VDQKCGKKRTLQVGGKENEGRLVLTTARM